MPVVHFIDLVYLGLSIGRTYFFVFGSEEKYFYCESGTSVTDAKEAERQAKSGDVIVSPYMWTYCNEGEYEFKLLKDDNHVKVVVPFHLEG